MPSVTSRPQPAGVDDGSNGVCSWFNAGAISNPSPASVYTNTTLGNGLVSSFHDQHIQLVVGGAITSTDKATGTFVFDNFYPPTNYAPYGGDGDLWGQVLTPAIVNSADFGVALAFVGPIRATHYLKTGNFRLSVPESATITGVLAEVLCYVNGTEHGQSRNVQVEDVRLTIFYTE